MAVPLATSGTENHRNHQSDGLGGALADDRSLRSPDEEAGTRTIVDQPRSEAEQEERTIWNKMPGEQHEITNNPGLGRNQINSNYMKTTLPLPGP